MQKQLLNFRVPFPGVRLEKAFAAVIGPDDPREIKESLDGETESAVGIRCRAVILTWGKNRPSVGAE
ncbi:MAG: hypothetical protein DMG23_06495 [Acidobacteria bacterium]|nr:MAG: hypothetical protein DMG23_06495 [Acidobacteriota bacterium]